MWAKVYTTAHYRMMLLRRGCLVYGESRVSQAVFFYYFFQSNKTALDTPGQVRHPMLLCFGFFSCVVLSLSVLVLLVFVFRFVALLVLLCRLVAVPGLCVLLLVRSLARLSGVVSRLVLVLLRLV